jgi:cyclophilin family peptidyl-prolyl cis-trans isomerase/HEAT repeat protein
MSRTLGLVRNALVGGLAACLLAAAPSAVFVRLLSDEQARSLGNGTLTADLGSHDERLAARAALAIGRTKQAAGEPLLAARLHDPRPAVRAMALYAIGLVASGREAAAVSDGLADPNSAVRAAALDAADRYEAARRFAPAAERHVALRIIRLLARDPDANVRARAAAEIESWSASAEAASAARALVAAVERDASPQVRRFAMWSIFRGYAKTAPRAFLARELKDSDEVVRIEAVRAVGKRGDASDLALVRPLLDDPSWRVQEQSSETIRLLEGKPATQHWTRIPSFVHVPRPQLDPLRSISAVPMKPGPRARPTASRAILEPVIDPTSAAAMDGPAPGAHPRVRIVTTKGDIYVVLFPEWAPLTVENFLNLAARGYYSHNRWFRIVPDFVVQTGDRNDNGNGDAGYSIPSEENPVMQDSYVISMGLNYTNPPNAHAIRDSAGAQYYITLSPQLHLDRDFSVFGEVTSGFDVLGRLIESDRVLRIERIPDVVIGSRGRS